MFPQLVVTLKVLITIVGQVPAATSEYDIVYVPIKALFGNVPPAVVNCERVILVLVVLYGSPVIAVVPHPEIVVLAGAVSAAAGLIETVASAEVNSLLYKHHWQLLQESQKFVQLKQHYLYTKHKLAKLHL